MASLYPGAPKAVTASAKPSAAVRALHARRLAAALEAAKPQPAKPTAPSPMAAPVSQSLSQVANQRVNAQINPQIAAQNSFNTYQTNAIQSFANALLGKMQPIAGQVGQDYDKAIGQTAALGNQAATFLQNANPSPQVAALLQSANAPAEQQAQIQQQLGSTFGGGAGVLAFTGATIPGSQLVADKAAAQAQASQLPLLAGLRGQQDLSSALWQQGQDRQKLLATRPALYQEAAQDIRTNIDARNEASATAQYRAATTAEKQRQFGITQQGKAADRTERAYEFDVKNKRQGAKDYLDKYVALKKLGLDTTELDRDYEHKLKIEEQADQRIQIAQMNAATSRYKAAHPAAKAPKTQRVDGVTYQWNAAGNTWEKSSGLPAAKATAAAGGLTPAGFSELSNRATKLVNQLALKKPEELHWEDGESTPIKGTGKTPSTYTQALRQVVELGPDTPAWHKKATKIVQAKYGTPKAIALQAAKDAKAGGRGLAEAISILLKQKDGLPIEVYIPALSRVYGVDPAGIRPVVESLRNG